MMQKDRTRTLDGSDLLEVLYSLEQPLNAPKVLGFCVCDRPHLRDVQFALMQNHAHIVSEVFLLLFTNPTNRTAVGANHLQSHLAVAAPSFAAGAAATAATRLWVSPWQTDNLDHIVLLQRKVTAAAGLKRSLDDHVSCGTT